MRNTRGHLYPSSWFWSHAFCACLVDLGRNTGCDGVISSHLFEQFPKIDPQVCVFFFLLRANACPSANQTRQLCSLDRPLKPSISPASCGMLHTTALLRHSPADPRPNHMPHLALKLCSIIRRSPCAPESLPFFFCPIPTKSPNPFLCPSFAAFPCFAELRVRREHPPPLPVFLR